MKWISVKDKHPYSKQTILITDGKNIDMVNTYKETWCKGDMLSISEDNLEEEMFCQGGVHYPEDGQHHTFVATHWCYIFDIELPKQQEKWNIKPHSCEYNDGNGCHGYCEEEKGKLNLVVSDTCEAQAMYVPYCPFCGYKLEG